MEYVRASDEELIAMIADGQSEALEALYDRYSGVAYSLALRILGDRGAAEEVVQDTFVSVWRRAGTYRAKAGRPYSWMLGIARNRAIDELRRRRTPGRDRATFGSGPRETPDPAPGPAEIEEDAARVSELRFVVGGALQRLPDEQREVLELAYLQGLTQREISERTGIPLGTVKTRTRLALKKLKETLTPLMRGRVDLDGV
ncbi:MAG: sigma-70 family RNA polymerase sigma factor [Actinomycetota bacterium]